MWLINYCLHFLKDNLSNWWCIFARKAYTVNNKVEVKYHLPKVFLVWLWPRTFAACHTTLSVVTCPHCICIYMVRTVNTRQMQQKSSLKKQNANNTTNSWGKQMLIYIYIYVPRGILFSSHITYTHCIEEMSEGAATHATSHSLLKRTSAMPRTWTSILQLLARSFFLGGPSGTWTDKLRVPEPSPQELSYCHLTTEQLLNCMRKKHLE